MLHLVSIQLNAPDGLLQVPVRKIGASFYVDLARVNPEMMARIFLYGITQLTNDSHASVTAGKAGTKDATLGLINKRWDAIYAGEWRTRGIGPEAVDAVTREALALARVDVRKAYGKKWKDATKEKRATAVQKHFDANESHYRKIADAIVASRIEAFSTVDLSDIGLDGEAGDDEAILWPDSGSNPDEGMETDEAA